VARDGTVGVMGIDSVWDWLVGLLDGWMGLVLVGWSICNGLRLTTEWVLRALSGAPGLSIVM